MAGALAGEERTIPPIVRVAVVTVDVTVDHMDFAKNDAIDTGGRGAGGW